MSVRAFPMASVTTTLILTETCLPACSARLIPVFVFLGIFSLSVTYAFLAPGLLSFLSV